MNDLKNASYIANWYVNMSDPGQQIHKRKHRSFQILGEKNANLLELWWSDSTPELLGGS